MLVYGSEEGGSQSGWIFDPKTNRWSTLPTNGMPFNARLLAWAGDYVVAFGGSWADSGSLYNARFRLTTQQWMPISNAGVPAIDSPPAGADGGLEGTVLSLGNDLFLSVNASTNWTPFWKALRYSPATDSWRNVSGLTNYYEDLPSVDVAPYSGLFAFLEGNVYGWDSYLGARYNPATDNWSLLRHPVPSGGPTQVFGSKLYAAPNDAAIYRYDPAADFWETLPHRTLFTTYGGAFLLATTNSLILVSQSDPTLALRYTPGQPIYLYEKR
jgi:hypothetical protein